MTPREISLWLDSTSSNENRWVVSRDGDGWSETIASYALEDEADARALAKDECMRTGLPVVEIDEHGNRETIMEVGPIDKGGAA